MIREDIASSDKRSIDMVDLSLENIFVESYPNIGRTISHHRIKTKNTEEYPCGIVNKFRMVAENPLSTFSIDADAASYTVAKDVKLQIEFNPTKIQTYKLVDYGTRLLNKEVFNNDTIYTA